MERPDYDEEPHSKRDYWIVLVWTVLFYAVPAMILIGRVLFLPAAPDAACTAAGLGGCTSPRAAALAELIDSAPLWLASLASGLILALVLRWASDTWRSATIGFCAAVVSGGAITVLYRIW